MNRQAVRERPQVQQQKQSEREPQSAPQGLSPLEQRRRAEAVLTQVQKKQAPPRRVVKRRAPTQVAPKQTQRQRFTEDQLRVEREMRELRETEDLREIDDDVEDVATLLEWRALEHNHQPKNATWYAVLAAAVTIVSVGFLLFGNIIGALTIALLGGITYYIAQQEPKEIRYRLLTEGIAFNNLLYHYRDLESFNIVYEPGETKTVLLKSKKTFAPLLHMEIGDADPVEIRDIMIEFVQEDQELDEPLVDVLARRFGF